MAGGHNPAAAEIEVAERPRKALVKYRVKYIALERAGDDPALVGDGENIVALGILADIVDKPVAEHLVKSFGKIKVHNIVRLHDYIVKRHEIERIIDILHKVKDKYLDIFLTSDKRTHKYPPF